MVAKYRSILLGFAALTVAAPALAAEPFNGPFIGAQAGWLQNKISTKQNAGPASVEAHVKHNGFAYGGFIGYDAKLGESAVLGLEVGVGGNTGGINYDFLGEEGRLKTGRTFDVTARAGFLATPQTLVYVRGGWVNTSFKVREDGFEESVKKDGWTLGGGVEQAVTENVSARLEYGYSRYGRFDNGGELGAPETRAKRHAIKAGVAFRF